MRATFYTTDMTDDGEIELRVECHGDIIDAEPEVGLNETTLQDVIIDKIVTHPGGQEVTAMYQDAVFILDEAHDALWEAREAEKDADADHHFEMWKNRKL